MSELKNFNLPDVGEGLTEAEILNWHVQAGEQVAVNQTIVEIETAKASVELPSPYDGVVGNLFASVGDTVDVGTPIMTIDTAAEGAAAGEGAQESGGGKAAAPESETESGGQSVLVGYGPRARPTRRRPRKARTTEGTTAPPTQPAFDTSKAAEPAPSPGPAKAGEEVASANGAAQATSALPAGGDRRSTGPAPERAGSRPAALAKPPVRKRAKDLGVDLATVEGTGMDGVITREDVSAAARGVAEGAERATGAEEARTSWDANRERRIPVKGVRKRTAAAMVSSAFSAPHVTEFLTLDVTPTVEAVQRIQAMPDFAEVRVSPLLLASRALLLAIRRHPMINSSWDEDAQEIVVKDYVNLGIAVASTRGLIVPNIKGAESMSVPQLAYGLRDLVTTARDGKTSPADMRGGTVTITNVGVFGVDTGTPILNPGESAILALGTIQERPWVVDGQVVPRQVMTLSVSFDHRIVDGELGSKFLADIGTMLGDPAAMLAWS